MKAGLSVTWVQTSRHASAKRPPGERGMKRIDVFRTSASRPGFFKASTESLLVHLKSSGRLRWLVHEDYLNREASRAAVTYAKSTGLFDVILESDPPMGQGLSLNALLRHVE